MKILSWNCRGLSNPRAVPNLKKLAQQHRPDIIFLSETLANKRKMENIRVTLKFEACLSIDVEGRSGGLAVLWRNSEVCSVLNFTRNFVNLMVKEDNKEEWRLSCYYGFPERSRRKLAWDMIRDLRQMSSTPWCIIGDFNDLLSQDDKRGIHPHPNWLCLGFRKAISDCDLVDIPLEGYQFTWVKSRGSEQMVEERLDRAFASPDWLNLFPTVSLTTLIASHSDHSSILLSCEMNQHVCNKFRFRFENSWLRDIDIKSVVESGWKVGETSAIEDRIVSCADNLEAWSKRRRINSK
ncbi:uncharacterized protein LOC131595962 [Vicia villosa]|uniref:uncharacterized protein LOC131595962 n=1 Tax=Vicia villosa TaxID=3911 RepID=UPI00273C7303|nr:uncharacterized protein LOC131595962 [Vicia villosa]